METRKKYHRISVSSCEEAIDKPFALLMDILKRPNLGNYVRHIECRTATSRHMDYKQVNSQRDLSNEEMTLVREAVKKGGFTGPQEDRVVNMLMQRMEKTATFSSYLHRESLGTFITQALTAILIVVSPNVVSMALTDPSGMSCNHAIDFPLAQLLRQANASPENKSYLRNLRDVYVINKNDSTWSDGRFYVPMDFSGCLRLFDNLQSIESVRVDIMEEDPNGNVEFKEKCSNISKISIHNSSVDSLYLANLIWSCKILKEFQYSIGGRASNDGGFAMFNPKAFIKVLCAHKKTLEILDVDAENEIYIFEVADEEERDDQFNQYGSPFESGISDETCKFYKSIWTYNGSLKEFVALKRLSLGINFLLYLAAGVSGEPYEKREKLDLVDCLPVGLEYLCVRGYQKGQKEEHDEQMDALMTFYKSGASQLKEVKGIDEFIPNAEVVKDPDNDDHLLWSLEEIGYESD
ncbi:hypothetical protein PEX1_021370 [Penicillium expansum]|uniref:Leucine-rich repeat domain-containing protein n=1 Tax=Penicillium expansum TaxID=27334 RepID=A0A0A2IZ62_PENEN|nr:hypothetical protein PEX2_022180 [Penicillium expansum]KGO48344.1 hypothetical protein PEX1_021370 [Penicillium expansum]KGO49077.1 hypothetical protein PEXP_011260 [Penicillium expansum]KGO57775.1 hypothetical protein PEX2_022180 [Penicillium expansum]